MNWKLVFFFNNQSKFTCEVEVDSVSEDVCSLLVIGIVLAIVVIVVVVVVDEDGDVDDDVV